MSTSVPTTGQDPLPSESEQEALLKLLADEDSGVYRQVREKILSFGQSAVSWLSPYALSKDPVLRRRSQEIVESLKRQDADNNFLAFCLNQGSKLNLESGLWLLAQTKYPSVSVEGYRAILDSFVYELMDRVDFGADVRAILKAVNRFLFEEQQFAGNEEDYFDPENSYLNRVIDRRTGNPISLCAIYLLLADRLAMPITGIGMPGHFVCRYQSNREEIYIDAFNRGRLLSKRDCIRYLNQAGHGYQESFLGPVSSQRILLRICANLHRIYGSREEWEEMARIQRYIVALSK